jgi:hypothetical protein
MMRCTDGTGDAMQINKEDAAKYLVSLGYDAKVSNGVVMVYVGYDDFAEKAGKILRKVRKAAEGVGYLSSVGVAPRRDDETADNGGVRGGKAGGKS